MSKLDTLQQRLAEAIWCNVAVTPGVAQLAADAVMQALHLHEEHGRLRVTRFVTDWFIDE